MERENWGKISIPLSISPSSHSNSPKHWSQATAHSKVKITGNRELAC